MEEKSLNFSRRNVKHEPPVEFVLILSRPTSTWLSIKEEEDVKRKWMKSVKMAKFDAKWLSESTLFQTFFTCHHCQLVVKKKGWFTRHLKTCSKINTARIECDHCGKIFQKKGRMRKHMLKHSIEGKFRCNKCGFGFKNKAGLLHHSRSKNTYKCITWAITFACRLLSSRHRSDFHRNLFECDKCSYQTGNEGTLINHEATHNKPNTCETCKKKFALGGRLKLHQMQHSHGIYLLAPEETFDCDKCDKSWLRLISRIIKQEFTTPKK